MQMLGKLASPILYAGGIYQHRWERVASQGGRCVVLAYHRIRAPRSRTPLFGIERGIPSDVFAAQMRFARRHFQPLRAAEAVAAPGSRAGLYFAVTFDDGYADNAHFAVPVLRELGISATFYLNSGFVGTERRFWWEQLGAMLRETRVPALERAALPPVLGERHPLAARFRLESRAERARAHQELSACLMKTPHAEIDGLLEHVAEALGVRLQREGRDHPLLDWEQASRLREQGFDLGAHGTEHLNLGLASEREAENEILGSIRSIEAKVGGPVETFAFPYGKPEHRGPCAIRTLERTGCVGAFTTDAGAVGPRSRRWALPRRALGTRQAFACAWRLDQVIDVDPS